MNEYNFMMGNMHHQKTSRLFKRHIKKHKPVLVSMSEAYVFDDVPVGYQLVETTNARYDTTVRALIRNDCDVISSSEIHMTDKWTYNGRTRKPRAYLKFAIKLPTGEIIRVMCVHFEPGGPHGENAGPWHESLSRTERFLDFGYDQHADSLVLGDFNALAEELNYATKFRVHEGGKVDHVISTVCRVEELNRLLMTPGVHGWYNIKVRVN